MSTLASSFMLTKRTVSVHFNKCKGGGSFFLSYLFFKKILFIFRQRGKEGDREKERKKYQCVVASHMPPTGDLAHNSGLCPDWE